MGLDIKDKLDFYPMQNVQHDYAVLQWMNTDVKYNFPATYKSFISMVSSPMYEYVVGDFARNAMCAIGIVATNVEI